MSEEDVPTPGGMWQVIVGLKDASMASFDRVERQLATLVDGQDAFRRELTHVEGRLSQRITRLDDRLSGFQTAVVRRLDDHESRISSLEERGQ